MRKFTIAEEALLYDKTNDNTPAYYARVINTIDTGVQYICIAEGDHIEDKFMSKESVGYELKIYLLEDDMKMSLTPYERMDHTKYKVSECPDHYKRWGRSILNRWMNIE